MLGTASTSSKSSVPKFVPLKRFRTRASSRKENSCEETGSLGSDFSIIESDGLDRARESTPLLDEHVTMDPIVEVTQPIVHPDSSLYVFGNEVAAVSAVELSTSNTVELTKRVAERKQIVHNICSSASLSGLLWGRIVQ